MLRRFRSQSYFPASMCGAMRFQILVSLFLVRMFSACSTGGEGSPTNMDGVLFASNPALTSSLPNTANIFVWGRSRNPPEFEVNFDTRTSNTDNPTFQIKGLPDNELLIFQVTGDVDATSSFPLRVDSSRLLFLGALPSGTTQSIINDALGTRGKCPFPPLATQKVDRSSQSIILGTVAPGSTCAGTVSSVDLVDRNSGSSVLNIASNGPYYFDSTGCAVATSSFRDSECNYVMFNIAPGDYRIKFLNGGSVVDQRDVIAIAGQVMYGYDIP